MTIDNLPDTTIKEYVENCIERLNKKDELIPPVKLTGFLFIFEDEDDNVPYLGNMPTDPRTMIPLLKALTRYTEDLLMEMK